MNYINHKENKGESERSSVCLCSTCSAGTCDGCTFHFLWESASACPRCAEDDYHQIEGVCKGGVQVTPTPSFLSLQRPALTQLTQTLIRVFSCFCHCIINDIIQLLDFYFKALRQKHKEICPGLSSGNSVCVERAEVVHQRCPAASQKLLSM